MNPELDAIIKGCDNPIEALFVAIIFYLVEFVFRVVEVVIDLGEST